jgi:hypothetical protein
MSAGRSWRFSIALVVPIPDSVPDVEGAGTVHPREIASSPFCAAERGEAGKVAESKAIAPNEAVYVLVAAIARSSPACNKM